MINPTRILRPASSSTRSISSASIPAICFRGSLAQPIATCRSTTPHLRDILDRRSSRPSNHQRYCTQTAPKMHPLSKSTFTYATHEVPLECDVYEAADYPEDAPVFLYFHSGGLVTGSRVDVHPWMVQVCKKNKWPLVSASYRFLPHVNGKDFLADGKAAYDFARNLGGRERKVIIGGGSAGFFMATITTRHVQPKPLALLSITGLPTFRHPFYRSSNTVEIGEPLTTEDVNRLHAGPVSTGTDPRQIFDLNMLLPSGAKNPDFDISAQPGFDETGQDAARGSLYAYYLVNNLYESLVGVVDDGFDWAKDPAKAAELAEWPFTVFIQGDADAAVDMDVSLSAAKALGPEKATFCLAKGGEHLFELANYIEDEGHGMDVVRDAVAELERAVAESLKAPA